MAIGTVLQDRYEILGLLGKGGMGTVYQARDRRLDRLCAVKLAAQTSPEAEARFRREAALLANLHHPNLPRVTDYFSEGDRYYLVMDYVQGADLSQIVSKSGPLAENRVLAWMPQIFDALHYLHAQQPGPVIHRDIKPSNIKLTPSGQVMLVDFGLAKVYEPGLDTLGAAKAISPGFSPPEQYGGEQTDARSDIYSLGATLYYLLTGQPPQVSIKRLTEDVRLVPPRNLNPDISDTMGRVILKALELRPKDRFQSVSEMRTALLGSGAPKALADRLSWPMGSFMVYAALAAAVLFIVTALTLGVLPPRRPVAATPTAQVILTTTRVLPGTALSPTTVEASLTPLTATVGHPQPIPTSTATMSRKPAWTLSPTMTPYIAATTPPAPTSTLAPLATVSPTGTPAPVATSRVPSPSPSQAIYQAPMLLQPPNGIPPHPAGTFTFVWHGIGPLAGEEWYRVEVWKDGAPVVLFWSQAEQYEVEKLIQGDGHYNWRVSIVRRRAGEVDTAAVPLGPPSEQWGFWWTEKPQPDTTQRPEATPTR